MSDDMDAIVARVEQTMCSTYTAGDTFPRQEGRISRADFDALLARLRASEEETEAATKLAKLSKALLDDANHEARELRALLADVAEDACSMRCPSTGKAGTPIAHTERCLRVTAAIDGERALSQAVQEAVERERERCAKIARQMTAYDDALQMAAGGTPTGQRIAAAIRSKGE